MSVSLEDVSKHLGLSVSTVSKALNGYRDVSPTTKKRIVDAANLLGYHPSASARNLRRQRTEKIGFLFNFPVTAISEYASRLITGAVITAEREGYNLILYPWVENEFEQLIRICRAREVDGLLLLSRAQMEKTAAILSKESMPSVIIGRRAEQADISFINPDYIDGAMQVVRHLISLGHRRIGYTIRPNLGITSRDRLAGYQQALAEANIEFDGELVVSTSTKEQSGYHAMNQLLNLPNPPTALFAIHDLVAVECLQAAKDRGLRIPEDVAIVGFDDWGFSLTTTPPLTTVRTPLIEMGQQAMTALLKQINEPDTPPVQHTLPVELVIRQSTVNSK